MTEKYTSFEVTKGKEQLITDSTGDIYAGNWQQSHMDKDDDMITIGFHDDPMRGPQYPSKINIASLYMHLLITGQRGYGKSTLTLNVQKQLMNKDFGLTYIDPKGDNAEKLLGKVPEHRLDDVVWFEPGSNTENKVCFNVFNENIKSNDPEYEQKVNTIAADFIQILKDNSDTWGVDIGNITSIFIKQLIRSDNSLTPTNLLNILKDKENRKSFAEELELESEYIDKIPKLDNDVFEPILSLLRKWSSTNIIKNELFNKNSKISISEIIKNNKILIVNTANIQSPSIKEILHRIIISQIWSTMRMEGTDNQIPHFLTIDEFDKVISETFDINSVLSQARSYKLGICVSFLQMSRLPKTTKTAVRQIQTPISFNAGGHPGDCASVAQLYDIGPQRIRELDRFEAISHVYSKNGYKSDEPMKVKMFAEYPPIRENAQQVIEKSIKKYGCKIN